ncbi:MAG: hypothetical protein JRJ23_09210, partial [Deltaproteobacteria bacterium]|nr:hypothetical protein [Deltaproteobacteria bacterium]
LFVFTLGWSQESADSTRSKKLKAEASVSINSNGIAYVPAFSLDKPAIIGTSSLIKGRFSYDPQLSYGLDLKPWIIDNWFHYKIVDRPVFEFKAGAVISAFFSEYETEDETILQAQKYLAVEFISKYKFSPKTSLAFTYLLDRGQDPGTVTGHFFNLQADRSDFNIGRKGLLSASLQLFYINYTGNEDGLFTAAYVSASLRDIPFSIFGQAVQALTSNIDPFPPFKWNVGLAYTL